MPRCSPRRRSEGSCTASSSAACRRSSSSSSRPPRASGERATLPGPRPPMNDTDLTHSQTPDGTFLFERTLADGRRIVAVVLPEDVDEIAGPLADDPPGAEEKKRRFQVAKLLAEF